MWKWKNEASSIWTRFVDNKNIAQNFADTEVIQYYFIDKNTWKEVIVWEKTDAGWWITEDWKYPENMEKYKDEDIFYKVIKRPKIVSTFVDIKNPKIFESSEDGKIDSFELMMDYRDEITWAKYMVWSKRSDLWMPYEDRMITSKKFREYLQEKWYDWIILKDTLYDWNWKKSDQFVVFEPTQIKSAYENKWTFDKTDPRIKYQKTTNMDSKISSEKVKEIWNNYPKLQKYVTLDIMDKILTKEWYEAFGRYYQKSIDIVNNPKDTTLDHEVFHAWFDLFTSPERKAEILKNTWIKDVNKAEEFLAEKFAEYVKWTVFLRIQLRK